MSGKLLLEVPLALDVINGVVQRDRDWGWQMASTRSEFHRLLPSPFLLFESTRVVSTNIQMSPIGMIVWPRCAYGHALLLHIATTIIMMDNACI